MRELPKQRGTHMREGDHRRILRIVEKIPNVSETRTTAKHYRKQRKIFFVTESPLQIPEETHAWVNQWRTNYDFYKTDSIDNEERLTLVNKLDSCINKSESFQETYKSRGDKTEKEILKTIKIAIEALKEYIEGKRFDKYIDSSLYLLRDTYKKLKEKESGLSECQQAMLSVLEPLKEVNIVEDPVPLHQQYAMGGVERIRQYYKQQPYVQDDQGIAASSSDSALETRRNDTSGKSSREAPSNEDKQVEETNLATIEQIERSNYTYSDKTNKAIQFGEWKTTSNDIARKLDDFTDYFDKYRKQEVSEIDPRIRYLAQSGGRTLQKFRDLVNRYSPQDSNTPQSSDILQDRKVSDLKSLVEEVLLNKGEFLDKSGGNYTFTENESKLATTWMIPFVTDGMDINERNNICAVFRVRSEKYRNYYTNRNNKQKSNKSENEG